MGYRRRGVAGNLRSVLDWIFCSRIEYIYIGRIKIVGVVDSTRCCIYCI